MTAMQLQTMKMNTITFMMILLVVGVTIMAIQRAAGLYSDRLYLMNTTLSCLDTTGSR